MHLLLTDAQVAVHKYTPINHLSSMEDFPQCKVFNVRMCMRLIASACGKGGHGLNFKYGIVSYPSN